MGPPAVPGGCELVPLKEGFRVYGWTRDDSGFMGVWICGFRGFGKASPERTEVPAGSVMILAGASAGSSGGAEPTHLAESSASIQRCSDAL